MAALPALLVAEEVADLLRVNTSTVYRWSDPEHPSHLPSVLIAPGTRRWRREVVLERIEQGFDNGRVIQLRRA